MSRNCIESEVCSRPNAKSNFLGLRRDAILSAQKLNTFLHGERGTRKRRKKSLREFPEGTQPGLNIDVTSPGRLPDWAQEIRMQRRRISNR